MLQAIVCHGHQACTIVQSCSRQSYKIKLSDGQVVQRHADHIYEYTTNCDDVEQSEELEDIPVSSQNNLLSPMS